MSFSEFVDEVKQQEKTLTVFTAETDYRLFERLEQFFEVQNIAVRRGELDAEGPTDFAVLHQGDDPVAVSTLADVRRSLLLDDSDGSGGSGTAGDRGDAGARGATAVGDADREALGSLPEEGLPTDDADTPDVISSLGNTTFSADGDNRMLLTQITHYVLDLAFRTGGGTLHVGVQRLSTVGEGADGRDLYERLAEAGVEVHLYGTPDADLPVEGVHVHGIDDPEVEGTRFAVFDGAGRADATAAMVATEPDPGRYRGFWTFDDDLTADLLDYLEATY